MARAVLDQEHKERNGTRTEQYEKVRNSTEEYKTVWNGMELYGMGTEKFEKENRGTTILAEQGIIDFKIIGTLSCKLQNGVQCPSI